MRMSITSGNLWSPLLQPFDIICCQACEEGLRLAVGCVMFEVGSCHTSCCILYNNAPIFVDLDLLLRHGLVCRDAQFFVKACYKPEFPS